MAAGCLPTGVIFVMYQNGQECSEQITVLAIIGPVTSADRTTVTSMRVVRWWDSLPRATRVVTVILPVLLATFAAWAFNEVIGQHHRQFDLRLYYDAISYWLAGHDLYSYAQPDPVNVSLGFTYPPVAALLMTPMGLLSYPAVLVISLTAIMAAGAVFVYLGLLVLLDLLVLGRRGSRWTGVGIGLATAIKLTPGIFIVYLLVVGRWRAAATAIGTVIAANLISLIIAPAETWKYFTSLMWQTSRVGFLDTSVNQSINGLIARLDAPFAPSRLPWLLLAVAAAVIGLWRARRAALGGDELAGLTLAGLVGVLISPVSWVHHIIWVFPAMLIVAVRLKSTIGALAADDSGYRSSDRVLMGRIAQVVGYSVLMTAGLAIWCIPTASLINVRDVDYEYGGALLAFAGSVQLLWMLAVLVVLPRERSTAPAGQVATDAAVFADAAVLADGGPASVDTGSVPVAARATRVVLPGPVASPDARD